MKYSISFLTLLSASFVGAAPVAFPGNEPVLTPRASSVGLPRFGEQALKSRGALLAVRSDVKAALESAKEGAQNANQRAARRAALDLQLGPPRFDDSSSIQNRNAVVQDAAAATPETPAAAPAAEAPAAEAPAAEAPAAEAPAAEAPAAEAPAAEAPAAADPAATPPAPKREQELLKEPEREPERKPEKEQELLKELEKKPVLLQEPERELELKLERKLERERKPKSPAAPKVVIERSQAEIEEEFFFAIELLLKELQDIRGLLNNIWEDYKKGTLDLIVSSLMTNTAIDLVRQVEQAFETTLQRPARFPTNLFPVWTLPALRYHSPQQSIKWVLE
ncbi:hypothetical protein PtrSN001A_010076, partial [Pyrenophora tritici-repentis]